MAELSVLLAALNGVLSVLNMKEGKRVKKIDAVTSIKNAITATRDHYNNNGEITNIMISNLWRDAFNKTAKAKIFDGNEFAKSLSYKADFWANTNLWLSNDAAMELVPKLSIVEDQCNALLESLK